MSLLAQPIGALRVNGPMQPKHTYAHGPGSDLSLVTFCRCVRSVDTPVSTIVEAIDVDSKLSRSDVREICAARLVGR